MTTQHTSGPWWASNLEVGTVPIMTVKVCNHVSGSNCEEAKANARLIAAAPDLLEALKLAVTLVHVDVILVRENQRAKLINALEQWNAAITKATGETKWKD